MLASPVLLLNANTPALLPLLALPPRLNTGLLELGKLELVASQLPVLLLPELEAQVIAV